MSTAMSKPVSFAPRAFHWAESLLGTALVAAFIVFTIGNGLPPLGAMNASFAAIAVMLVGFLLAWWHDLTGAVVSLVGIGAFYALELVANGHAPGGWGFPLCFVPGVLGVVGWLLRCAA
jgi:hypothetical protein